MRAGNHLPRFRSLIDQLFLFTRCPLDKGQDVLVAGLDLDFRAMPFGEMLNLT
ncbi:MAG: hypothetical protein WB341_16695 [Terracidiphilus sp.]